MMTASKIITWISFALCCCSAVQSLRDLENEIIWNDKLEKFKKLAEEYKIQEPEHIEDRTVGTDDFNITFTCDPKPTTVHQLRPRDIDVIAAMGDSLTAANGANASTIVGVAREYRGISWFSGGDGDVNSALTLPNIIRAFNPQVKGYSTGYRFEDDSDWWFNVAVPGARANDMPDQARILLDKMMEDNRTNYENDWKLVTIFIGGNDLCALKRSDDAQPENYVNFLKEALDMLHKEMPRTLVNLVDILEIYLLPQVGYGFGSTRVCRIAQRVLCEYIVTADENETEIIRAKNKEYQRLTQELIDSGRYDTRDDFTVVIQPFFRDTVLPYTENGEVDATFFAPDCFHLGSKGHAMGAINLWNNMLEPVGNKSTQWSIKDLKVPTKESPYIFTRMNSIEMATTSSAEKTTPTTTTERTTKPTTLATTTDSATTGCDDTCVEPEVEDWLIAVVCVLGVALIIQTFAIVAVYRKNQLNNKVSNG